MQQIVFEREFFAVFDASKTENVHREKAQPIKKIVIEKVQKRNLLKFEFLEIQIDFQKNLFEVFLHHTWDISIPKLVSIGFPV